MFGYVKFWFQAGAIIVTTVIDSILVILLSLIIPKKYDFFRHYRRWSSRVLFFAGISIEVIGGDILKPNQTYIYITNHTSLFDIPIILLALNDRIRIMYKRELEKIPIFGTGLKKSPFIAVSRSNARDAMASIEEALESIRGNLSVILFPEGTRSKDGKLGLFKRGAFLLAARSGKPILPVTIIGASEILPKHSFRFNRKKIIVVINPPFYSEQPLNRTEEQDLMNKVHAVIKDTLEKYKDS